jgi:hypothetical protein
VALPAGSQAFAQSLRGVMDEDPILRVGRTAGDENRDPAPKARVQTGEPQPEANRPGRRRPVGSTPGQRSTAPATAAEPGEAAGVSPQPSGRPRQQNFRSLERPINNAVTAPAPGQLVHQGLPPPTPRPAKTSVNDPYAPLGLRVGALLVFPTVEGQVGQDSNPERRTGQKKGSTFVRTEAGFTAKSEWAVHELTADIKGGYSRYFQNQAADRPDAQGRIGLRLDASRDTAFDFELRGRIDSQTPGSANLTARAEGRPLTYQYGGSTGVTQRFNRLAVSARASIDKYDFADAPLGNGEVLSQKDRNYTQYGLRLRSGYEITPSLIPFAEALLDTRRYDLSTDNRGFQRDSNGMQLRGGASFELTRLVTAELAAGYGLRRYEDQRLRDLRGPVVEGTLNWSVSPLTNLRLRGTTEFEETTQTGSSGTVTRRLSAELSHAFLRNLVFNLAASYGRSDYNGISRKDDTLRALVGVDYSLTRNLVLRASYTREQTTSNVPGNAMSANVWLFGAKWQY